MATNVFIPTKEPQLFKLTAALRWKNGVLQQQWIGVDDGKASWRDVPDAIGLSENPN